MMLRTYGEDDEKGQPMPIVLDDVLLGQSTSDENK